MLLKILYIGICGDIAVSMWQRAGTDGVGVKAYRREISSSCLYLRMVRIENNARAGKSPQVARGLAWRKCISMW